MSAATALFGTASAAQEKSLPADVREAVERLRSPLPAERARAACSLGRMEGRAAGAVPFLVELLSDGAPVAKSCGNEPPFEDEEWAPDYETVKETTVGEAATHALMAIGDAALDGLIDTLTAGESWRARKNAAWALAHRGDRHAMQRMLVALGDPAWQVRVEVAYALFQRGGASEETVKALIAATHDEAWQVRRQAVFALGHKGAGKVDVVEPLLGVLRLDRDARVREEAAGALWHTADGRAFPRLMEALKDREERVRERAADTLGNRAGNDEVPLLIAALKDEDADVRRGAKRALKIVERRSQGRVTNLRPLPPGIPE
jgi:HEAT repeat protein